MSLHINRTVTKMPDSSSTSSSCSSVCVCVCVKDNICRMFVHEWTYRDLWAMIHIWRSEDRYSLFPRYWGMVSPIISALLHTYSKLFRTWDSGRFSSPDFHITVELLRLQMSTTASCFCLSSGSCAHVVTWCYLEGTLDHVVIILPALSLPLNSHKFRSIR